MAPSVPENSPFISDVDVKSSTGIDETDFRELSRQNLYELSSLLLGQLKFKPTEGQSLMSAHLLFQGPVNRAGKVLRINVEGKLLTKRVAQLSRIVPAAPCLLPIVVDITIVIGRFGLEIDQVVPDFRGATVLVDD